MARQDFFGTCSGTILLFDESVWSLGYPFRSNTKLAFYFIYNIYKCFFYILCVEGVDLSDMKSDEPYDYKFVKWMIKTKVGNANFIELFHNKSHGTFLCFHSVKRVTYITEHHSTT